MLKEQDFLKLIENNGGFEVTLGFRDDVDHFLGGTGDKIWYFIREKFAEDYYVCTLQKDGEAGWTSIIQERKKPHRRACILRKNP